MPAQFGCAAVMIYNTYHTIDTSKVMANACMNFKVNNNYTTCFKKVGGSIIPHPFYISHDIRTCKNNCMAKRPSSEHLKKLGENIKRIRMEKGLSLRQMAAYCTIDYSDIAKIEKGTINITLLTLVQLAKALEVQPGEIIDFEIDFDE